MYLPPSSMEASKLCPVWSANACMSFTEPQSVEIILSTCPDSISASAFLVFTTGKGHDMPLASNSLSKFIGSHSCKLFKLSSRLHCYIERHVHYRNSLG